MKAKELGMIGTLLDKQKSDSSNEYYQISWNKNSGYACTCPGFTASKRNPKVCKHIKRFEFKFELERWLIDKDNLSIHQTKNAIIQATLNIAKKVWGGVI